MPATQRRGTEQRARDSCKGLNFRNPEPEPFPRDVVRNRDKATLETKHIPKQVNKTVVRSVGPCSVPKTFWVTDHGSLGGSAGPLCPTPAPLLLTFSHGDQGSPTRGRCETAALAGSYRVFQASFCLRDVERSLRQRNRSRPGRARAPNAALWGGRPLRSVSSSLGGKVAPHGSHPWGR